MRTCASAPARPESGPCALSSSAWAFIRCASWTRCPGWSRADTASLQRGEPAVHLQAETAPDAVERVGEGFHLSQGLGVLLATGERQFPVPQAHAPGAFPQLPGERSAVR